MTTRSSCAERGRCAPYALVAWEVGGLHFTTWWLFNYHTSVNVSFLQGIAEAAEGEWLEQVSLRSGGVHCRIVIYPGSVGF